VLAALAALAGAGVMLPAGSTARVVAGLLLLCVLPGLVAGLALPSRPRSLEAIAAEALTLSLSLGMLIGTLVTWRVLPLWLLAAAIALPLALLALALPRRTDTPVAVDAGAWLTCTAIALVTAAPLAFNPVVRVYGDALFHGQIVNEIALRGLPPADPSFAGMSLAYAWPMHAGMAALARLTGASPYALAPALAFLFTLALALVFVQVARVAGASSGTARLVPLVVCSAMNGFGVAQAIVRYGLAPWIGATRGEGGIGRWLASCLHAPYAGGVAATLVYHGSYMLASLLYKFLAMNQVAPALVLAAAAYGAVLESLRENRRGALAVAAVCSGAAVLAHPVVGTTAAAALGTGIFVARCGTTRHHPTDAAFCSVLMGAMLVAPALTWMLSQSLLHGMPIRFGAYGGNLAALAQALAVSGPVFALAFPRAWRDDPPAAGLAIGYAAVGIGASVAVRFPSDAAAYPVYVAYLGTAWLIPQALMRLRAVLSGRRRLRIVATVGLALLPWTTLLVVLGFLRHDARWGLAGYPETNAERAVFDRLCEAPRDAVIVDTQNFQMSAAAGYSGRQALFGGMEQVRIIGYPAAEMQAREHAIRDLLYGSAVEDSTWRLLERFGPHVYVVARRAPSGGRIFDRYETPAGNPIAKLDTLVAALEPVVHTPEIALYRYVSSPPPPPASRPR